MADLRTRPIRIGFQTLGCKLNQFETDSIASQFLRAGYEIVPFDKPADAYIINTCTVTNKSDRKSRNTINRALRSQLPGSDDEQERPAVVVTGCFVESHRSELESIGLNYVVGNNEKNTIFPLLDAHFRGEILHPTEMPGDKFRFQVAEQIFHTRSMVKIQDGCDNFCSFCIIPFVRGRAVSRPVADVLENVRETVDGGAREIVLTGVNLSRYAGDGTDFSALLEKILEVPGNFRLRISSMEPDSLDDRFFDLLDHPKMCPHLHLCLQSGSERVLLQMRRQYTYRGYRQIVDRIIERVPGFNLTTDVIVGFPGETEEDFEATANACREIGFSHIHTFPYSRRDGTRAERMPGHVSESEKKRRGEIIRSISDANKRAYRARLIGSEQTVLVERVDAVEQVDALERVDGAATAAARQVPRYAGRGYGEHYVPVEFELKFLRPNEFYRVKIDSIDPTDGNDDPALSGSVVDGAQWLSS